VCHQRAVSGLKPTVFHEPLQVNLETGGEGVGGGTGGMEVYSTEYPLDQWKQQVDCDSHGQTQSREWVDGDNHRTDGLTDVRHFLSTWLKP
jgi:hypothetical protein